MELAGAVYCHTTELGTEMPCLSLQWNAFSAIPAFGVDILYGEIMPNVELGVIHVSIPLPVSIERSDLAWKGASLCVRPSRAIEVRISGS